MASLRKKYQVQLESPRDTDAPVTSPPEITAAELPEPVADAKPPEQPETESPADVAARTALKARLAEMERAEGLARQAQQQPPQQHATEQQQMPAAVAKWLAEHPQYMDPNDQIAQVEISLATMKATRDGLTWNDDDFLPSIERHLGIAPRTNGHAETKPTPQPTNYAEQRNSAPARPVTVDRPPPQRMSVPVSAPPTREAPSMRTGRPVSYRAPLTPAQREAAQFSGVSEQEYADKLERMNRMKAAGEIQG